MKHEGLQKGKVGVIAESPLKGCYLESSSLCVGLVQLSQPGGRAEELGSQARVMYLQRMRDK